MKVFFSKLKLHKLTIHNYVTTHPYNTNVSLNYVDRVSNENRKVVPFAVSVDFHTD